MSDRRPPIRVEILYGAFCGLGLSLLLWIPYASPALRKPGCLAFVALAALSAALARQLWRRPIFEPACPAILAALLVYGLGPAVATAGLAGFMHVLAGRRERSSQRLFEPSRLSLAATGAGLAHLAIESAAGGPVWSLAAYAAGFAVIDLAISVSIVRRTPGALVTRALGPIIAAPLAWPAAAVHAADGFGPWLALVPATLVAFHLGRALAGRHGRTRPVPLTPRSASLYRSLTLGFARAASGTDPSLAAHQRRVESLSRGIAERLGLPLMELEALGTAALLHESDRVALLDGAARACSGLPEESCVATHPSLAAELVSTINYPYPVLPIVRHLRERWDGGGRPDGLVGDAIPRGARILAVADCYDSAISGRQIPKPLSSARAVARLREQAGSRFDPLVVDLLAEYLQSEREPSRFERNPEDGTPSLRTGEKDLELLGGIRRAVEGPLGLDDRLTLIAARAGSRLAHQAFVVYRADEAKNRLIVRFAFGKVASRLRNAELPADRGIFGLALSENRAVVANPADLPRAIHEAVTGGGASCLLAPVPDATDCPGVLALYDDAERRFSDRDRDLVVRLARLVGLAGEEALAGRVNRFVLTDSATGLPNAGYLRLALARRLPGPGYRGAGFGLVAIAGVDHTGEDRRWCVAARRLAVACDREETLARFGPEQFVLLTSTHRPGELVERTEQMLRELQAAPGSVRTAHAAYPQDAQTVEGLLSALDTRLALCDERASKLLAFRPARSAS